MATAEAVLPRAHSRLRKIDLRVAVGLLLMLVAVVGGAGLIKAAQARIPVLVAAGTVEPGAVITAADLRVAEVSLAGGVAHLPAEMQSSLVGQMATEPWWEGKLLGPGSAAESTPLPAGSVAMSLLLKSDRAAGLRTAAKVLQQNVHGDRSIRIGHGAGHARLRGQAPVADLFEPIGEELTPLLRDVREVGSQGLRPVGLEQGECVFAIGGFLRRLAVLEI